jgi:hypothetical protein
VGGGPQPTLDDHAGRRHPTELAAEDPWAPYGAAAGVVAVALFVSAAFLIADRPAFDAPAREVAAYFDDARTRIQVACALSAAAAPLLIWFFATVASLTRTGAPGTRRAGTVAKGCGFVFVALFLVDVTALATGALRPDNMRAHPELAVTLVDFEWLIQGMAAFLGFGLLAAFAILALRDHAVWPRWVGALAAVAAPLYVVRVGTLFTTDGVFAADGALGLYMPVVALAGWIAVGSMVLAGDLRAGKV